MKKLIVILGPTAVGKTALGVETALLYSTEIVSADSRQFFSDLKIGVARPSSEELACVPHHFIGFLALDQYYSAGHFERDALVTINRLFEKSDVVVCAGGSGLYINAIQHGLDDLPSDPNLKSELSAVLVNEGIEALQVRLSHLDPNYFTEVDQSNPHRLIRAIEVCTLTGLKYSDLRKGKSSSRPFEVVKIGLTGQRDWLYNRINQRVDLMIEQGLIEEARSVYAFKDLNALNTVGYKELFEYFEGKLSLEYAVDKIKQHTRNFAKRQLTWWNREEDINWVEADRGVDLLAFVKSKVNDSK